jgi:predicted house-cleaning noncanonical NTP pyrophosphatase (MazG superfamily)
MLALFYKPKGAIMNTKTFNRDKVIEITSEDARDIAIALLTAKESVRQNIKKVKNDIFEMQALETYMEKLQELYDFIDGEIYS